jgi:hypothetical protein
VLRLFRVGSACLEDMNEPNSTEHEHLTRPCRRPSRIELARRRTLAVKRVFSTASFAAFLALVFVVHGADPGSAGNSTSSGPSTAVLDDQPAESSQTSVQESDDFFGSSSVGPSNAVPQVQTRTS